MGSLIFHPQLVPTPVYSLLYINLNKYIKSCIHPGVLGVRGRPDFSRFDPRPERPHFSNFGPPAERRPFCDHGAWPSNTAGCRVVIMVRRIHCNRQQASGDEGGDRWVPGTNAKAENLPMWPMRCEAATPSGAQTCYSLSARESASRFE
eukprot:scaffold45026_cov72-Phaeocystis_antarctica.AAC.6